MTIGPLRLPCWAVPISCHYDPVIPPIAEITFHSDCPWPETTDWPTPPDWPHFKHICYVGKLVITVLASPSARCNVLTHRWHAFNYFNSFRFRFPAITGFGGRVAGDAMPQSLSHSQPRPIAPHQLVAIKMPPPLNGQHHNIIFNKHITWRSKADETIRNSG